MLQILPKLSKVVGGRLQLLGTGHVLTAGLLDAFHRRRNLIDSNQLLLAGSGNLSRCLGALDDSASKSLDGFTRLLGLFDPGFNGLASLLRRQNRSAGRLLYVIENGSDLVGRLLGLLREAAYL